MNRQPGTCKRGLLAGALILSLTLTLSSEAFALESPAAVKPNWTFFQNNTQLNTMIDEDYQIIKAKGYSEKGLIIPKSVHGLDKNVKINEQARYVADKLIANGNEVYVNGGASRDMIMDKTPNDVDLSTNLSDEGQEKLFENDPRGEYHSHTTDQGRTFGYVDVTDGDPNTNDEPERIDLATYQNTPAEYVAQDPTLPAYRDASGNIPLTSDSLFYDSIQRDLSMNAVFFNMKTEELVDYHGGLHDLREGEIATIVKPDVIFASNPEVVIRSLRFMSRYQFKLEDSLEKVMRKRGAHYAKTLTSWSMENQVKRMWQDDYSLRCYQALDEYGIMPALYPQVSREWYTEEYRNEMEAKIKAEDLAAKAAAAETDDVDDTVTEPEINRGVKITSYFIAPAVRKELHKTNHGSALECADAVIAEFLETYGLSYKYQSDFEKLLIAAGEEEEATMEAAPITVKGTNVADAKKTFSVKKKKIDKAAVSYAVASPSEGVITFTNTTKKSSLKKYLSYANGKVKLKKKAPKGSYTFKLTVNGDANYKQTSSGTVTIKVK